MWDTATSSLHETPRSLGISALKESKVAKTTNPITSSHFKTPKTEAIPPLTEQPSSAHITTSEDVKPPEKIPIIAEKFQRKIEKPPKKVDTTPTPVKTEQTTMTDPDAAIVIKTAFKSLIQKLHKLNGEEFSNEMAKIADLILEKKGFSVTLHKIRSKINQYKTHLGHLSDVDISRIIESIEEWENHIL